MTTFSIIGCCIIFAALMFCLVRLLYKQQSTVLSFQCECVGNDAPRLGYVIRIHRDGAVDATVIYGDLLAEYDLPEVENTLSKRDLAITNAVIDLKHDLCKDYCHMWTDFAPLFDGDCLRQYFISCGDKRVQFNTYKEARAYADVEIRPYLQLS